MIRDREDLEHTIALYLAKNMVPPSQPVRVEVFQSDARNICEIIEKHQKGEEIVL
jgi:hypothetical protein